MARRAVALLASIGLLLVAAIPTTAANINSQNSFVVTNLQSNVPGRAAHTDPDLVNGWGITASATSPWWVADNGTQRSREHRAEGPDGHRGHRRCRRQRA